MAKITLLMDLKGHIREADTVVIMCVKKHPRGDKSDAVIGAYPPDEPETLVRLIGMLDQVIGRVRAEGGEVPYIRNLEHIINPLDNMPSDADSILAELFPENQESDGDPDAEA